MSKMRGEERMKGTDSNAKKAMRKDEFFGAYMESGKRNEPINDNGKKERGPHLGKKQ